MASSIIAEISSSDLQAISTPSIASITDVKQLSSYNWIERTTPTIVVPGSPPFWCPPKGPQRLQKDSGFIYIAQNASRHPDSPLEPLFRALYITHPSFDIGSIDVVTDRNNIRKLLSFVSHRSTGRALETFTISIEVTKNTAIFCREETETQEFIGPHEFRGFGHEFEKVYTVSQIRGSTGHHRIISYRFNNLNFIVRYETDGYVDSDSRMTSSSGNGQESAGITSMLASLSLSSSTDNAPDTTPAGSKLVIREEGRVVPLESTLEIKTRVSHKPLEIQEVAPQLWISQTPLLVRAYHNRGTFLEPEVEDVAAEIKRWEQVNQGDLKKLAALIDKILAIVKGCGGNATVKYDSYGNKLVVRKAIKKPQLPKDLYSKWDGKGGCGSGEKE